MSHSDERDIIRRPISGGSISESELPLPVAVRAPATRAESPFASGALFAATGAFAALHYPIAQAQLYRAVPESSGSVNALSTALGALAIPLPLLLGVAADRAGLGFALALLLVQPLGVGAAALIALRARR